MKLKHFFGYGSVTATKVSKTTCEGWNGKPMNKLVILVKGSHERGMVRENDEYLMYNWLVKRFDKSVGKFEDFNWHEFQYFITDHGYKYTEGKYIPEEYCEYTFIYPTKNVA